MKINRLPPRDELKALFLLDPDRGVLMWRRNRRARRGRSGEEVGTLTKQGYRRVNIAGRFYLAHRVIYSMAVSDIPDGMQIDHVNGDVLDNRPSNLRIATHSQNNQNSSTARGRTGVRGVNMYRGKYRARIYADGKLLRSKVFASLVEAAATRRRWMQELHGEFACA